jgi:hypothetical protein
MLQACKCCLSLGLMPPHVLDTTPCMPKTSSHLPCHRQFGRVPLLDPESDMKLKDKALRKLQAKLEGLEGQLAGHPAASAPGLRQRLAALQCKQVISLTPLCLFSHVCHKRVWRCCLSCSRFALLAGSVTCTLVDLRHVCLHIAERRPSAQQTHQLMRLRVAKATAAMCQKLACVRAATAGAGRGCKGGQA